MKKIEVDLDSCSYPILIEEGSLIVVGERLESYLSARQVVAITDEHVDDLYGEKLVNSLGLTDIGMVKLVVSPGEESKSISVAKKLYQDLAKLNLSRDSVVVAFGGGVVGDLAGFVASTFLRGLRYVQVPTTLLAQVDSSVGGKTGVNLSEGKNLVGTFYQPRLVLIDPEILSTLSDRDVRSGLGEILKYGIIWDKDLLNRVVSNIQVFQELKDCQELEGVIARCCGIKTEIVTRDEKDRGLRKVLNFGHTLGHGIEAGLGYGSMRHGEAVIWGMVGELWISYRRGNLSEDTLQEVVDSLTSISLPKIPQDFTQGRLLEYVSQDKKSREETIYSVIVNEIGEDVSVEPVDRSEIGGALDFIMNLQF